MEVSFCKLTKFEKAQISMNYFATNCSFCPVVIHNHGRSMVKYLPGVFEKYKNEESVKMEDNRISVACNLSIR